MSYIIKMALDIKARFEPPAPITSPLEAIAKAMKLDMPARKDTLFDMRAQLDTDIGGDEPADERIGKLYRILMNFIRNDETTDQMMEYVTYGYEHEA